MAAMMTCIRAVLQGNAQNGNEVTLGSLNTAFDKTSCSFKLTE